MSEKNYTIIENEFNYLHDASVAKVVDGGTPLRVGFPSPKAAFCHSGEWLVATRDFRLPGGSFPDGVTSGANVEAGQRFRLRRAGSPVDAAVWEIA